MEGVGGVEGEEEEGGEEEAGGFFSRFFPCLSDDGGFRPLSEYDRTSGE